MVKRAVVKAALLVSITVLLWALSASLGPPKATFGWTNVVSELFVCLLLAFCIFLVTPAAAARRTYCVLLVGLFVTYGGAFQDVLDELRHDTIVGKLIEDIGYPLGLTIFTVGLVFWVYEHERTYKRLRTQKRDLEHLTVTDELTGLFNARHFMKSLEREIERSERYDRKLALLFMDIDNFKRFNDSYGHVEGNRVLQVCARIINDALRESDSSYRFGGEEFTVILPETGADEAFTVAERIRVAFEHHVFELSDGESLKMTISGGLAELRENDTATTLIERSDGAMYEAKMLGKNRVLVWRPDEAD